MTRLVIVIARSAATKQSHRERAKSAPWVWIGLRAAVATLLTLACAAGAAAQEWPSYGGDPGGQRFSGAMQITPQNVGRLAPAWIFHTGEHRPAGPKGSSFEDTPILADGKLLVCTSTDRVFALDPLTGRALWAFDPKLAADDRFASSVVALDGTTGAFLWSFQTTHHDIWDYDVAAQPSLVTLRQNGHDRPAVVVATKTGFVFMLDRDTGHPLFPVTERPVPESDVPGEAASPTQPVPSAPPPLVPQRLAPNDAWGVAFLDRWLCRRQIEKLRSDGLYTPPSLRGTII